MATDVPQRMLRNETAALLRRVQAGERLRITVHGHPVAELVPLEEPTRFVPREKLLSEFRGLLSPDDTLAAEIRAMRDEDVPRDPFE